MHYLAGEQKELVQAGQAQIEATLLPQPIRGVDAAGNPVGPETYSLGAYGWLHSVTWIYQAQNGYWVLVFPDEAVTKAAEFLALGGAGYTDANLEAVANAPLFSDIPPELLMAGE